MAAKRKGPAVVAIAVGAGMVALGIWAMALPRSFFDRAAVFEPYNQHFIQDLGAFQIGLGAVLLLAGVVVGIDAVSASLIGVGVGAALHALSHVVGRDLGGDPAVDIPVFAVVALVLLTAGTISWRSQNVA